MTLVRFNPRFQTMHANQNFDSIDRMMNQFLNKGAENRNSIPAVNLLESGDEFVIEMAAPGYKKEDFKIEIENNSLSISAEIEDKTQDDISRLRSEFSYGSFERIFRIGKNLDTDKINASYENGILSIRFEKKEEAKLKPVRNIQVN